MFVAGGGLPYHPTSSGMQHSFLCSFCHILLVEPKFATCGHRYCSPCFKKAIKNDQAMICVVDGCNEKITNNEIYTDFAIENDLKHLTNIVCHNRPNGCSWQGDYTSYRDHLQMCEFQRFQCESCSILFSNRLLYEQHDRICPNVLILCPLNKFGCDTQIRRESLRDHLLSSLVEHFQMFVENCSSAQNYSPNTNSQSLIVHSLSNDIKHLQNELMKQTQIIDQLRCEQKSLQSMLIKREKDLTRISVDLQLFKGELCQLKKEFELSKSFIHNDGTYLWRIKLHEFLYDQHII